MTKEDTFYDALRDVFVGAKIEGKSGYINLMQMKNRYFKEIVSPKLQEDIEAVLDIYPQFREELFDKLYDFFNRYFSESGSIFFRRTRYPQSVYEQVYTDQQDVILFWKTHMLYYVKTERLFKNLEVEFDDSSSGETRTFFFDVSDLEHKQAYEKRDLVFRFSQVRTGGTIVFKVKYSSHGSKTKVLDIMRALRSEDLQVNEEVLQRAFRVFEKQSEVDYFINKDAEGFLKEQFDLWMYRYLFQGQNVWSERRIDMLQELKVLAYKIIDSISQFEDELVRVWNKPKFVRDSHYVITLDHIASRNPGLLEEVLEDNGMSEQIAEWHDLGMISEDFSINDVWKKEDNGMRIHERFQYLPLDTCHIPEKEIEILGLFENLDKSLDGWLIHSENYQALKTIEHKFREKISVIYIDPPYNSESSEIDYVNTYKDSSWLTLIENRLEVAKRLLDNEGVLIIAIDDFEFDKLTHVIKRHFPERLGVTVVRSNPAGRSSPKGFSLNHEYAVFFAKEEKVEVGRLDRTADQIARYGEKDADGRFEWVNFRKHGGLREEAPNMFYPIYISPPDKFRIPDMSWDDEKEEWIISEEPKTDEIEILPIDDQKQKRRWKWTVDRLQENPNEVKVDNDQNGNLAIYIKSRMPEGVTPPTWWGKKEYSATDHGTRTLKDLFGQLGSFSYPKAVELVKDCLKVGDVQPSEIVLDFFAGSGTTAQAVMNLTREDGHRRKYILVEMADYFDDVLLPRVKKVAFSSEWKDGMAQAEGSGMSQFVKYYALEQYEDVLRNAKYVEDSKPFVNPYKDPYNQYIFMSDLKQLHSLEINSENQKVQVKLDRIYNDIDLAESLANVRGKRVATITSEEVTFEDGECINLQNPDWELIKSLIWW